jgi:pimeloyl-ACP methyl ester carboxylesterase
MSEMIGADPDALDRLAAQFRDAAHRIDQLRTSIGTALNHSPWHGYDADGFRDDWRSQHVSVVAAAAAALSQASSILIRNAADQRRTSSAATGALGAAGLAGILHGVGGTGGLHVPPSGTDPKAVASWWAGLSPEDQARLIRDHHREIGNLDGIPAHTRSDANNMSLQEDLKSHDKTVLENAKAVDEALREKLTDPNTGQPADVQLLIYEPAKFGGDGRAAVVVGDIDTADNVAFCVPGITSDIRDMPGGVNDAYQLYNEANKTDHTHPTAVVSWIGYNAPRDFLDYNTYLNHEAKEGAKYLAADVNGVLAARDGDRPHVTIVGHSYGTVTTSKAAQSGDLPVDDIVLLGSPGTDANRASQLGVGSNHVFVGTNSEDPVGWFSGFGRFGLDPADLRYGAVRFDAETPGTTTNVMGEHSRYYEGGSESLYNISQIVSGHYGEVDQVPGRLHSDGLLSLDLEAFRDVNRPSNDDATAGGR